MEIPEAKSLNWLMYNFPFQLPPKDEADKMCNAIHLYAKAGAAKLEEQQARIEELENERQAFLQAQEDIAKMQEKIYAMTDAIRQHVPIDDLCELCKHNAACATESLDETGQITRYWRCKAGDEFEFEEG